MFVILHLEIEWDFKRSLTRLVNDSNRNSIFRALFWADAISVSFDSKKIRPDDTRALALLQEVDYAEHTTEVYSVCVNG